MANHIFRIFVGAQDLPTYPISGTWKFVRGADETADLNFNVGGDDVSGINEPPVDDDELQLALEDVSTIGAGNVATRSLANCIFLLDFNGATTGDITLSFVYDIVINANVNYTISGAITVASLQAAFDAVVDEVEIHEVEAGNKFVVEFRGNFEGLAVAAPPEWPATVTNNATDQTVTLKQLTFSGYINSWTVEFTGALADTLISDASVSDTGLTGYAGTITLSVEQVGIEDVPVTVDVSVYVEAVAPVSPVNEVQRINLNGATSGTYFLTFTWIAQGYNTTVISYDATAGDIKDALDAVLDFIFESPATVTVTDNMDGTFDVEFDGGGVASLNVEQLTVSSDSTSPGVTVSTLVEGVEEVVGVKQVTRFALSGVPDDGGVVYGAFNINYDATAGDIETAWNNAYSETVNVTGSPADEIIDIEHDDYDDHVPPAETANSLAILGVPTQLAITLEDDPDSGTWKLATAAGEYQGEGFSLFESSPIAWDASYSAVAAAISTGAGGVFDWTGLSGDGQPGTPWLIQSDVNVEVEFTSGFVDLGKAINLELITLQAGGTPPPPTPSTTGVLRKPIYSSVIAAIHSPFNPQD